MPERPVLNPPLLSCINTMSDDHQTTGLIILGNSGVGKSFLANILLNRETFAHKAAPTAVTSVTEVDQCVIEGTRYSIFNIPGLIEANQERIDFNKREIDNAFQASPNAIVIYVFGNQNGRIRNEDIAAFKALHLAYPFNPESLILVMNCIPEDREVNYEEETTSFLIQMLGNEQFSSTKDCFLDRIDKRNKKNREQLRVKLVQAVKNAIPSDHKKQMDIQMEADRRRELEQRAIEEALEAERALQRLREAAAAEQRRQECARQELARVAAQQAEEHRLRMAELARQAAQLNAQRSDCFLS